MLLWDKLHVKIRQALHYEGYVILISHLLPFFHSLQIHVSNAHKSQSSCTPKTRVWHYLKSADCNAPLRSEYLFRQKANLISDETRVTTSPTGRDTRHQIKEGIFRYTREINFVNLSARYQAWNRRGCIFLRRCT